MNSPLQKMRFGAVALGLIVVAAVLGFRFLADYEWLDAVWMVVITISTVGYGEESAVPTTTKVLSVMLILTGVTAGAYTFTGVIQMILVGEFDRALGKRKMKRELEKLSGHTIVCGFGKSGPDLCERLGRAGRAFLVIENLEERVEHARKLGYMTIVGDATDEKVLSEARIDKAAAIVVGLPTDAENVFITLSARNVCPDLRIVASAERESSSRKLKQAGADEVVLTHQMVADHMSRLVTHPSAAQFIDVLSQTGNIALEIDELTISQESAIANKTIAESRLRDLYHLMVVGTKHPGERFEFNPTGDHRFLSGQMILVMGKGDDIEKFRTATRLQSTDPPPNRPLTPP